MLLGPIFRAELLRTARRKRYYVLRSLYGAVLLLLVWASYMDRFRGAPTTSIAMVASFAEDTFVTFAVVQMVVVVILIPPLFGGAIADERQRKTLHFLMASRLSSGEIIMDKMLGRAPHLGVFLAMGLPVVSILGLFGGVPFDAVLMAYLATASTAIFAAALMVLLSTYARRVRLAVLNGYLLLLLWMFFPTFLWLMVRTLFTGAYRWVSPVNDWLTASSPVGVWASALTARSSLNRSLSGLSGEFVTMIELQLGAAALMLAVAVWRLRPVFRRQESATPRRRWFTASAGRPSRRWFARPVCGDDAVLWKERYFAHSDAFTRLVLLPAIVIVTLPLALLTESEGRIGSALAEFWKRGFRGPIFFGEALEWALRVDLGWYVGFWLLAVAGTSASSIAIERERDTWVGLTSTPLTGWQIIRGKVLGAIWHQRGFGAVIVGIWLFGLISGAVHPLGILASVALVGLETWLVAMIGIHASLRSRSTSRALMVTILVVGVFNAYPIILSEWFLGGLAWNSSFSLLGAMPRLAVGPVVSYQFANNWWAAASNGLVFTENVGAGINLVGIYLAAAVVFTVLTVGRFDRCLDRPRLTRWVVAPARTADREVPEPALS